MSQSIISAGTQLAVGRFQSALITPTFTPTPHNLTFTRRRPITLIMRASASMGAAATESISLYVPTGSFYDLLGIPENVTAPEIKQAYRKLARKYHPDVSPPEKAEEFTKQFLRVQEAYETLSDPRSRAEYDRDLASGFHLGFSARKQFDKGMDPKGGWRQRWESQVEELQSMRRGRQSSWGDRMRSRRSSCDFSFD